MRCTVFGICILLVGTARQELCPLNLPIVLLFSQYSFFYFTILKNIPKFLDFAPLNLWFGCTDLMHLTSCCISFQLFLSPIEHVILAFFLYWLSSCCTSASLFLFIFLSTCQLIEEILSFLGAHIS